MEPDPIHDTTTKKIVIDNSNTSTSIGSDLRHHHPGSSDTEDSHTEGKPSPPPPPPSSAPTGPPLATRQQSPSTDTDRSASPTRSKKRAIDTMLDGEEDKECIVMEKQPPPPLPKRQTPPSPTKSKVSSSSSPLSPLASTFMDRPLYIKGDVNYDQAASLLDSYRQCDGILATGAPILNFFDQWIKEVKSNYVHVADALFDLLLENYNPATDEQLVSRIPLVMNQILQKKYPPHS